MKGLFEWKLLAIVFAVLIVASSALVSNFGVKDIFMNSTGDIGDWINSPFGTLFSTPQKTTNFVTIKLLSGSVSLSMDDAVNITTPESTIDNFQGIIVFDFDNNRTHLIPAGTDLKLDLKMKEYHIENIKIHELVLEDTDYIVRSENTNITAEDDKIEIYDFVGKMSISDGLVLEGNVTLVKDGQWSIG